MRVLEHSRTRGCGRSSLGVGVCPPSASRPCATDPLRHRPSARRSERERPTRAAATFAGRDVGPSPSAGALSELSPPGAGDCRGSVQARFRSCLQLGSLRRGPSEFRSPSRPSLGGPVRPVVCQAGAPGSVCVRLVAPGGGWFARRACVGAGLGAAGCAWRWLGACQARVRRGPSGRGASGPEGGAALLTGCDGTLGLREGVYSGRMPALAGTGDRPRIGSVTSAVCSRAH